MKLLNCLVKIIKLKLFQNLYVDGSVLNYIIISFDNFTQMQQSRI